jgi:hypothetical protein
MLDSHNVVVVIKTVFDYTPEAIDRLFSKYRSKYHYSAFIECRFNPVKQQFVLEGDGKLMEYALSDFIQLEKDRKPDQELFLRSKPTQLNISSVHWDENVFSEKKQWDTRRQWGAKEVCTPKTLTRIP